MTWEISENIMICFWRPPITETYLFGPKHTLFGRKGGSRPTGSKFYRPRAVIIFPDPPWAWAVRPRITPYLDLSLRRKKQALSSDAPYITMSTTTHYLSHPMSPMDVEVSHTESVIPVDSSLPVARRSFGSCLFWLFFSGGRVYNYNWMACPCRIKAWKLSLEL
jgi:hypothetical protein